MLQRALLLLLLCTTLLFAEKIPLTFKGNSTFTKRELFEALNLHKPYFYEFYLDAPSINPKIISFLKQTLQNYYKTKGFFHAKVIEKNKNGKIIFIIDEGESVLVEYIEHDTDLDTQSFIPFIKGDRFDADIFTQSKEDLRFIYANENYCAPQIEAKAWIDIDLNKAYLSYKSRKNGVCRFGAIVIEPSETIEIGILESLLYFEEGEPFSALKINQSYQSLYSYEGIKKASIDTEVKENNEVDIKVKVSTNEKPIRFEMGIGISSDEGAMTLLGIKHRNFLDNLKTISLYTRLAQIKQTVKITYDMPLLDKSFFGSDIGYENEDFKSFSEYRFFSNLYLKQKFFPLIFQESIVFDSSKTYDMEDVLLFPEKYLFVTSLKLELNYDTRDKILEPSRGYFINVEVMGSLKNNLFSDASYYKYKLSGGYITPFLFNTLALKSSLGSLNIYKGDIPASYRFFAGGMQSNRGYGYRKLGPTDEANNPKGSSSLLEATAEYRFGIYKALRGVVFSDISFLGNYEVPNYDKNYLSAGVGLRYKTPIGPIAIDAGFDTKHPKEQYAFHFRIGEAF
ncbi:MAG: BamA/TamA family outer membrane protein [Sulfurimonadaceae bacterium]|nr:BamA/TamA family outer membrane protein [Sulfurimonadaceae bacterium]